MGNCAHIENRVQILLKIGHKGVRFVQLRALNDRDMCVATSTQTGARVHTACFLIFLKEVVQNGHNTNYQGPCCAMLMTLEDATVDDVQQERPTTDTYPNPTYGTAADATKRIFLLKGVRSSAKHGSYAAHFVSYIQHRAPPLPCLAYTQAGRQPRRPTAHAQTDRFFTAVFLKRKIANTLKCDSRVLNIIQHPMSPLNLLRFRGVWAVRRAWLATSYAQNEHDNAHDTTRS